MLGSECCFKICLVIVCTFLFHLDGPAVYSCDGNTRGASDGSLWNNHDLAINIAALG